MEHWLPLFYEPARHLFDYLPRALVMLAHQAEEARTARLAVIADYYATREQFRRQGEGKETHQVAAL
jgi:transcription-repair coupling factor (superfamily II helicase)